MILVWDIPEGITCVSFPFFCPFVAKCGNQRGLWLYRAQDFLHFGTCGFQNGPKLTKKGAIQRFICFKMCWHCFLTLTLPPNPPDHSFPNKKQLWVTGLRPETWCPHLPIYLIVQILSLQVFPTQSQNKHTLGANSHWGETIIKVHDPASFGAPAGVSRRLANVWNDF